MSIETIEMKDLLEAGVHFGHKSSSWDPKMKKYIFMKRKGVHIIDLQKTLSFAEKAHNQIKNIVANGGKVLFVGTKKQARQAVINCAKECKQYYVSQRWIGGLLTNFKTVRNSVEKLIEIEQILDDEIKKSKYNKKQLIKMEKEKTKLENVFGGVKEMTEIPQLIFAVDSHHEKIAVREAKKMGITIAALVDTNANPELIDIVIPGNDDAIRAISLFLDYICDAVKKGMGIGVDLEKNLTDKVDQGQTDIAVEKNEEENNLQKNIDSELEADNNSPSENFVDKSPDKETTKA